MMASGRNFSRKFVAAVSAGILLAAASVTLHASTVLQMSLAELTAAADTVVLARCTATEPEWIDEKIFTHATFAVDDTLKGAQRGQLRVTVLGGVANHPVLGAEVRMEVAGGATFAVGEEVVVFTRQNARGTNQVIGLSQGKFEVSANADTGTKTVRSGFKRLDVKVVAGAGGDETRIKPVDPDLQDFLSSIREIVSRQEKGGTR